MTFPGPKELYLSFVRLDPCSQIFFLFSGNSLFPAPFTFRFSHVLIIDIIKEKTDYTSKRLPLQF